MSPTSVTPQRLRQAVEQEGSIDTHVLFQSLQTDVFCQVFDAYLEEASEGFIALTNMAEQDATFTSLVEPYHALAEHAGTLWLFLQHVHRADGNARTQELIAQYQPRIRQFIDECLLSTPLYQLFEVVLKQEGAELSPEARRSLELLIRARKDAGVHLPDVQKSRMRAIHAELMKKEEAFGDNVVESKKQFFWHCTDEKELGAMPEQDKKSAAQEARSRNKDGWVFTLSPPSKQAALKYVPSEDVRRLFYQETMQVGIRSPHDNRTLILEILALRKEKAELLGYTQYAEYVLQNRMAKDVAGVDGMFAALRGPYAEAAKREMAELCTFAGVKDMQLWDISYYAEQYMQEKFQIRDADIRPYFELHATLDGMFSIAKRVFGLEMRPSQESVYTQNAHMYEAWRDNVLIGYVLCDLFARPTKRAGAWCGSVRDKRVHASGQSALPIVTIVCNIAQPVGHEDTLLPYGDVVTLFHEFGHVLHALLSEHRYSNTENFAVEWDFVELPSQLFENWAWEPESLALFAKHGKTGESMPEAMLSRLNQKRMFMAGFQGIQQLEYAHIDMELHTMPTALSSPEELDAYCLAHERSWQVLSIPDWYRMHASFSHIFEGEYAVGYYSYTWAELLEADVFERFQREGLLNANTGDAFRRCILAPGALRPAQSLYREFMGRDVNADALLRKKHIQTKE